MTDAVSEFLNENRHRAYPFVDESSFVSVEDESLPLDAVLDFVAVHRLRHKVVRLSAIVGPDSAGSLEFSSSPGFISVYFALTDDQDSKLMCFKVPVDGPSGDFWAVIDDTSYPQAPLCRARAFFGESILGFGGETFVTFTSLVVEPALITSLYRNQIDKVTVIHADGDDEVVGGDLHLIGGYNIDVSLVGSSLKMIPSLGAGTLGRFTGSVSDPGSSVCDGALLTINGQPPNERGEFFINGGKGVDVINLPDQNKIRIRLEPVKNDTTVCG